MVKALCVSLPETSVGTSSLMNTLNHRQREQTPSLSEQTLHLRTFGSIHSSSFKQVREDSSDKLSTSFFIIMTLYSCKRWWGISRIAIRIQHTLMTTAFSQLLSFILHIFRQSIHTGFLRYQAINLPVQPWGSKPQGRDKIFNVFFWRFNETLYSVFEAGVLTRLP